MQYDDTNERGTGSRQAAMPNLAQCRDYLPVCPCDTETYLKRAPLCIAATMATGVSKQSHGYRHTVTVTRNIQMDCGPDYCHPLAVTGNPNPEPEQIEMRREMNNFTMTATDRSGRLAFVVNSHRILAPAMAQTCSHNSPAISQRI
jgi:hypothetical protein